MGTVTRLLDRRQEWAPALRMLRLIVRACLVSSLLLVPTLASAAQETDRPVVLEAGRPLRVLLDGRTRVSRVGQPIIATVVEDVYAYDRIVVPAGAKVQGHVATLQGVPGKARAAAMLSGDFTPGRLVGLQFDSLQLNDGSRVSIQTVVTPGTSPASQEVAGAHDDGIVGHARQQAAMEARRARAAVRGPGKLARVGHYLVGRLPVHPQYLEAGTALSAQLTEPVTFGTAARAAVAPDGTRPPPESILAARLLTALDSSATERGAPVRAVLTRPLVSADQQVILPEGTIVAGKVTFVKAARGLRRNGQLRFLFDTMEVPGRGTDPLLATLYAADVGRDQHVVIDEEGGTRVTNPKSRFLAPALSGAALIVPLDRTEISDEALGALTTEANVLGYGARGFTGFGLLGVGIAVVSRPAALAFGAFGLARSLYVSLLGKGSDVVFPENTPMQIQLSPGTASAP